MIQYTKEELANEEWRPIKGYEGLYEVSNLGRIKRLPLGKQWPYRQTHNKIRRLKKSNRGYLVVNLSKQNKVKFYAVHRLVAAAFIPNTGNLPQINHKDENKTNNRVENLEWCNAKYNICYGTGRIENFEDLPAIDMAAIQNSCFAQTINSFFWFTDTTCQR